MITPAPKPPTELFERLVIDAGTPRGTCGFCGREHIASDGHLDEGELEGFRKKSAISPQRYREHACHSVGIGELNGITWVEGCECNSAWKYENFIWSHRRLIIEYLKERTAEMAKQAGEIADGLKSL